MHKVGRRHGEGKTGFVGGCFVHRIHWLCLQRRVLENFWSTSIARYETALRGQEASVDGTCECWVYNRGAESCEEQRASFIRLFL